MCSRVEFTENGDLRLRQLATVVDSQVRGNSSSTSKWQVAKVADIHPKMQIPGQQCRIWHRLRIKSS